MKVKTNFKKMYLIDANVYDRMNFNSMSQNSPQRQSSSSKSSISIDQHTLPHNSNYQSIRSFSGKNEPFNPLFPKDQSNHDRIVNEKKEKRWLRQYENETNIDDSNSNDKRVNENEDHMRFDKETEIKDSNQSPFDKTVHPQENQDVFEGKTSTNSSMIKENMGQKNELEKNGSTLLSPENNSSLLPNQQIHPLVSYQGSENRNEYIFRPYKSSLRREETPMLLDKTPMNTIKRDETPMIVEQNVNSSRHPPFDMNPPSSIQETSSSMSTQPNQIFLHPNHHPMLGLENSSSSLSPSLPIDYNPSNSKVEIPKQNVQSLTSYDPQIVQDRNSSSFIENPSIPKLEYHPPNPILNHQQLPSSSQNQMKRYKKTSFSLNYPSLHQDPSSINQPIQRKLDYKVPLAIEGTKQMRPPLYLEYSNEKERTPLEEMKITYSCTLCNLDFKKKSSLIRHNKNIHDAFYQTEKGEKRKTDDLSEESKKRLKTSFGTKRKALDEISFIPKKSKKMSKLNASYDSYYK